MKFGIKGFAFFFIATLIGGFAGGIINGMFGLSSGADIFTYIIAMLVPVLLTYVLYENYIRKKAV